MKIGNVSFGAKIDGNTLTFLVKARENGLQTKEMETLLKQVSPNGEIVSAIDINGDLLFMYNSNKKHIDILTGKYKRYNNFTQEVPYETNQETVDLITNKLKEIKKAEGNTDNKRIKNHKIYKRDHLAELKEIFGEPTRNLYDDNVVIEADY